jgi:hypothetical protein
MKREVTTEIVIEASKFLGKEGRQCFREYKMKYGTVSPVIPGRIPHPVHFREGMVVRNCLRKLEACKDWTDHDYDDTWIEVVERAITVDPFGI